jgi:hypothetical protein
MDDDEEHFIVVARAGALGGEELVQAEITAVTFFPGDGPVDFGFCAGVHDNSLKKGKRKNFFFEKKKQKTFATFGRSQIPPPAPDSARH